MTERKDLHDEFAEKQQAKNAFSLQDPFRLNEYGPGENLRNTEFRLGDG